MWSKNDVVQGVRQAGGRDRNQVENWHARMAKDSAEMFEINHGGKCEHAERP